MKGLGMKICNMICSIKKNKHNFFFTVSLVEVLTVRIYIQEFRVFQSMCRLKKIFFLNLEMCKEYQIGNQAWVLSCYKYLLSFSYFVEIR